MPAAHPKRVLIVGAGVSGLATLRNFTCRGEFEHVELAERRDDIGGVWYLDNPQGTSVPDAPRWPSPAYPGLVGNVLPEYLSFSQHKFPTPRNQYPTLTETHEYLLEFAKPLRKHIHLNIEVVSVDECEGESGWDVKVKDWNQGGRVVQQRWDAVVVAVAWYDNEIWPKTEGIQEAREKGLAKHAKYWRGPRNDHSSKRLVVVGNGNSSNDIAAQLAPVAHPIYRSIRHPPMARFPALLDPRIVDVGPIVRYVVQGQKLRLELADGTEIEDVDEVQVGTGYSFAIPFLRVRDPSTGALEPLTPSDNKFPRVPSLHRAILYAHNPTLAFIGNIVSYTPFTLSDLSSTWLALVWSSKIPYPETVEERLEFERERLRWLVEQHAATLNPSSLLSYHVLAGAELEYARTLRKEVLQVNSTLVEVLPTWNDDDWNQREAMYNVKLKSLRLF